MNIKALSDRYIRNAHTSFIKIKRSFPLTIISLGHFTNDLYMGFLSLLYPVLMDKFSLSLSQIGLIAMTASLASSFLQPVFGFIFDRYKSYRAPAVAVMITGVFISLLGIAPNYPMILVFLFLGCTGSAIFHPKGASIAPVFSGNRKEIGMAIFNAGGNLGYSFGPLLIASFLTMFGLRRMPYLSVFAAAIAVLIFLTNKNHEKAYENHNKKTPVHRSGQKYRIIILLILTTLFLTVGVRGILTFLPIFLSTIGIKANSIGKIFTIMLAGGAITAILIGKLSIKKGKKIFILSSAVLSSPLLYIAIILLTHSSTYSIGLLLLILGGIPLTYSNAITIIFVQMHSADSPAFSSSLLMGFAWGMSGLSMLLFGFLGDIVGIKTMLMIIVSIPILGAIPAMMLPNE